MIAHRTALSRRVTLDSILARPRGWVILMALGLLLPPATVYSQTGVSDDRVSLPDGPGSLEGIGDNASVDGNMGLMRYGVDIEVPQGFSATTPSLGLSYTSAWGNGVAGMGWSLDLPYVERMTQRRLPRYDADDDFITLSGDQLIRVEDGEPAIYRARMERSFVRYAWHEQGDGSEGYWTAEHPDGSIEYYGADADGQIVDGARITGPDGVFRYLITERVDVFGHRLTYGYAPYGSVQLVDRVAWVFGEDGSPRYTVDFTYEPRQDPVSDCRAAYEELLAHRLTDVVVSVEGTELRRYTLGYEDYDDAGGFSRLARVERYGLGGERHPAVFTFGYSRALGELCDGEDCQRPYLQSLGSLGVDLQSGNATLVDINGDALPDVVDTTLEGAHRIFLNDLHADDEGGFSQRFLPAYPSQHGTGGGHRLSSPHVQVLDIDGDGFADLLNRLTGQVLPNLGSGDWGTPYVLGGDTASDLPDFEEGFSGGDEELAHVRFFDFDGDRRIDVIRSQETNTEIYANLGYDGFVAADGVDAIGAGFNDTGMRLEDMNGDGLLDPVILRPGELSYKLNLGRGAWETEWTTVSGLPYSDAELSLTQLVDLNGDSLSDLVVVVGSEVRYALNRNDAIFEAPGTITAAEGGSIPERTQETTVLFADMNGNGSEDVIWIDGSGSVTLLELFPVRPNLLSRIENGLGMVTEVTYASSVEHMARDGGADSWPHKLPHPMLVVETIDTYERLNEVHEITRYAYHDGFYDGDEKRFRGYGRVEMESEGDEHQESSRTESTYDVGANDPYRAGLLLRQTQLAAAAGDADGWESLNETETHYEACPLDGVPADELSEPVRFVCATGTTTLLQERRPASEWLTLEVARQYDGYGNVLFLAEEGVTARGGGACGTCTGGSGEYGPACGSDCQGDERYTETDFVPPSATGGRWILGRPFRVRRYAQLGSEMFSEELTYYDGRSLGELSRGLPTRVTARVDPDSDEVVFVSRQRYDEHGHVVEEIDPNGEAGGHTHRRLITWDHHGLRPTQIDIPLEDQDGEPYELRYRLEHDPLHDQITATVGPILVLEDAEIDPPAPTLIAYDAFGRLIARAEPGDTLAAPTSEWDWQLGVPMACPDGRGTCPVNRVIRRRRSASGATGPDLEQVGCFDGLGRQYQRRSRIDGREYQVTGYTIFNRRGQLQTVYAPYIGTGADCDLEPPAGVEDYRHTLDGLGRPLRVSLPDDDVYGMRSERRTAYWPLETWSYDEEDTDPGSPHADTPTIRRHDGLNRLVEIEERMSRGNGRVHTYRYDELSNLSSLTDPQGNLTTYLHDLLGRTIRVDDPDRGTTTIVYDAAGNRVTETDARGITVRSTYDGLNRVSEAWDERDYTGTRIAFRYDRPDQCPESRCTRAAGQLVEVEYPGGGGARDGQRLGYDERQQPVHVGRIIDDLLLEVDYEYDNAGRIVAQRFPAGRTVELTYDGLDRIARIEGVLDHLGYTARGELAEVDFANGVSTAYRHDSRQRLSGLSTRGPAAGGIVDYTFDRDRVGNIVSLTDARSDDGSPHSGGMFSYDALYELVRADLDSDGLYAETIDFGYDDVRNLTNQTSSRGDASEVHVGTLTYGQGAGPHALTHAGPQRHRYDEAGYLTMRGEDDLEWDAWGRLVALRRGQETLSEVVYGPDQLRVTKREGAQVTHYAFPGYELRDGITWLNVTVGDHLLARVEADDLAAQLLSDIAPAGLDRGRVRPEPDGQITAGDAWVAEGSRVGALDLSATEASETRLLLTSSARRQLIPDGQRRTFHHRDHLESLVAVTDAEGAVVERFEYYPYGTLRHSRSGEEPVYGFSGKELDAASGLIYFGYRYYDPVVGRFISPDVAFATPGPNFFERPVEAAGAYLYAMANPLSFRDPDGREAISALAITGIVVGALAVVAAVGYVGRRLKRWNDRRLRARNDRRDRFNRLQDMRFNPAANTMTFRQWDNARNTRLRSEVAAEIAKMEKQDLKLEVSVAIDTIYPPNTAHRPGAGRMRDSFDRSPGWAGTDSSHSSLRSLGPSGSGSSLSSHDSAGSMHSIRSNASFSSGGSGGSTASSVSTRTTRSNASGSSGGS